MAHCVPINDNWLKKITNSLKDPKVAGIYGRQKPLSYSSDFDKRDLFNLFGPEKNTTLFFTMQTVLLKRVQRRIPFDEKTKHIEDRIWGNEVIKKAIKLYELMPLFIIGGFRIWNQIDAEKL